MSVMAGVEPGPRSRALSVAPAAAGTGLLLAQAWRRDRVLAPVWIAVMVAVTYASGAATPSLYATDSERVRAAVALDAQPAIVGLYGPILDVHSLGEVAMTKMTVLYAALGAVLLVVLVRRHTRVEEESGRAELVSGTAVGRDAPLAAALAESGLLAFATGLLMALAAIASGLPATGSAWFGVTWAGTGLVGMGVAAVACQLSASARTCAAICAGALGAAYVVRAVGDATGQTWLSWLSPYGWNTQLRAWSGTRGWVALLYLGLSGVLVVAAQMLRERRDLGAGLIAARPGPSTASPRLVGAVSLTVRVHSAPLVIWSLSCLALGALFGAITPGLHTLLDSTGAQEMMARLGPALIAAILSVMAIIVTCFGISVIGHAGSDESDGRTELSLSAGVSRSRWFGSVSLVAYSGSAWLLLLTGLGLAAGYAAAGGDRAAQSVPAALAWIPAAWVVVGLGVLGYGHAARLAWLGWAFLVLFLTITVVGSLLQFPQWMIDLSPYSVVPQYPYEPWRWRPEVVLLAVAGGALFGAWLRFRRRDIG